MITWAKVMLAAIVLMLGLLLAGVRRWKVLSDLCGNEVLATTVAPDRRTRAVLFRRDCGATTGFSTQVSVLRDTVSLPNDPGNVFVADDDHGRASPQQGDGPVVKLRWLSPARLEVRYDARARVFVADTLVDGIQIRYVKTAPPPA